MILIVEDDLEIREEVVALLTEAGHPVTAFEDGHAALAWLESATELPSVILLDLMMPGLDGWGFRARQQQRPRLAAIPVVLMSGAGDVKTEALEFEAAGFLLKPFTAEALLDAVAPFVAAGAR